MWRCSWPTRARVRSPACSDEQIGGPNGAYAAAGASIGGHIVPLWNGFRGGKGVATSAGACLAVFPVYFPLDAAVAAGGAMGSRNAEMSVRLSCVAFIVASLAWWRRQWPNVWGPQVTLGLPAFALAGSAMILAKFADRSPSTGSHADDRVGDGLQHDGPVRIAVTFRFGRRAAHGRRRR